MNDVTRILSAIEQGDPQAAEQLLPLVYDELRKLAAQRLAQEKPGQTLQATALVHEAYLRLVGADDGPALGQPRPLLRRRGRGHAPHPRRERPPQGRPPRPAADRERVDLGRGRARHRGPAASTCSPWTRPSTALEAKDPRKAELVKLRFFAGLTVEQAAEALGISAATADNDWAYATSLAPAGHARRRGGRARRLIRSRNSRRSRWANRARISHWHVEGDERASRRTGR